MTDHIKEAKNVCERLRDGTLPCNEVSELRAQTHALIAIAEQLRIANLLASSERFTGTPMNQVQADSQEALTEFVHHEQDYYCRFKPDVAEALGIKEQKQ